MDLKNGFEMHEYEQVQLHGEDIDMWVRRTGLVHDHIGYSIQKLFDRWKENPQSKEGYTVTSYPIKFKK